MRISDWSSDVCSSDLVGQAAADVLAVVDGNLHGGEVQTLVGEVVLGAGDIVGELVQQAVDDHHRLVHLVLQHGELAVVFSHGAAQFEGGAGRFEQEGGERGGAGYLAGGGVGWDNGRVGKAGSVGLNLGGSS